MFHLFHSEERLYLNWICRIKILFITMRKTHSLFGWYTWFLSSRPALKNKSRLQPDWIGNCLSSIKHPTLLSPPPFSEQTSKDHPFVWRKHPFISWKHKYRYVINLEIETILTDPDKNIWYTMTVCFLVYIGNKCFIKNTIYFIAQLLKMVFKRIIFQG